MNTKFSNRKRGCIGVTVIRQGFWLTYSERLKYLTKQKKETKVPDGQGLVTWDIDRAPKYKTHELTLYLAEQAGSEGEKKEILAKTRKQSYWQMQYHQMLSITNFNSNQHVQAEDIWFEIPFTED